MSRLGKLYYTLKKFDAVLGKIESGFSMICMTGVVVTVLVGVALRFIFKAPNPYGEELSRYLLVAAVFVGISIAQRERAHLGIDTLVNTLPKKLNSAVRCFTDVLSAFIYGFLAYESYNFVIITKQFGQKSPSMTFLPMYIIYAFMFCGFTLSAVTTLLMIIGEYIYKAPFIALKSEDSVPEKREG